MFEIPAALFPSSSVFPSARVQQKMCNFFTYSRWKPSGQLRPYKDSNIVSNIIFKRSAQHTAVLPVVADALGNTFLEVA